MFDFAKRVNETPLGNTYLFSVGQAGFILKSSSGQLLGIDLYLSESLERVEGHIGFKRMLPIILEPQDIVFNALIATHPHYDHFDVDAIPGMMDNQCTALFASHRCKEEISRLRMSEERVTYVGPGDSFQCGDFELFFVNCDHGTGAPDAVGVVIRVDGKTIYETGDTCLRLDRLEETQKYAPYDVLIAPINGAFGNLNERDCAELCNALKPRITIPCHYGMFASHGGSPKLFYEIMTSEYSERDFIFMTQGECLVI